MKISTKPMSSPSRTEKFPPPLMRFLRSNVGSRSRGRSRSSPMFIRKKNAVIETQEPTSPKVTCSGQVRVRRSSKQSSGQRRAPSRGPCSCKTLFSHHFAKRLRLRSFRPVWRKCVWFFRFGYCRGAEIRDDSSRLESNRKGKYKTNNTEDKDKDEDEDEDEEEEEEEAQAQVASTEAFNSSSPPKNALLLTRCSSAPYRYSSLANRFWGLPLTKSEAENDNAKNEALQHKQLQRRELQRPTPESEPIYRDSTSESKTDQESEGNLGFSRELEALINRRTKEISLQVPETGEGGGTARPLLLTRCKSEPARTGERLTPEASLWRQRTPHACD